MIEFFHDQKNRQTFAVDVPEKNKLFNILQLALPTLMFKIGYTCMVPKEKNYCKKIGREKSIQHMWYKELRFIHCFLEKNKLIFQFSDNSNYYWFSTIAKSEKVHLISVTRCI